MTSTSTVSTRMQPGAGRLVTAAGVSALTAALAAISWAARRWRTRTEQQLRERGTVVPTAAGPVEYADCGSGPALLILHGTPGGFDQGLALAELLAVPMRTVAISRPGYLQTPLRSGPTPVEQAEAAVAVLDALQIRRAAVVGVSGGGMAALQVALLHPHRVSRLVLWQAVTARLPLDLGNLLNGPLTWTVTQWAMLRGVALAPGLLLPSSATDAPSSSAALQQVAGTSFPLDLRRDGIANDELQAGTFPEQPLEDLRSPTLVIHGSGDTNVPPSMSKRAAELIPSSRLFVVTGGDHTTTLTDPLALAEIRNFLAAR